MTSKRRRVPAPRRLVKSKELIKPSGLGWSGKAYWLVRLECGHVYHRSPAKPDVNHVYCKKCIEDKT